MTEGRLRLDWKLAFLFCFQECVCRRAERGAQRGWEKGEIVLCFFPLWKRKGERGLTPVWHLFVPGMEGDISCPHDSIGIVRKHDTYLSLYLYIHIWIDINIEL